MEKVLPPPTSRQVLGQFATEKPAEKVAEKLPQQPPPSDLPTVKEPTLGEELDDEIPSDGDEGESGRKAPSSPATARRNHNKRGASKARRSPSRLSNLAAG
jgi:hypothetical protein